LQLSGLSVGFLIIAAFGFAGIVFAVSGSPAAMPISSKDAKSIARPAIFGLRWQAQRDTALVFVLL
jgi:hypothetical protein